MPEDVPDPRSAMAKSFSNSFEVEMVVGLVEYLVTSNEYDFKDITILTPYNGQLAALTQRLSATCSLWLSEKDRDTLVLEGLLEPEGIALGTRTDVGIASMLKLATIDNFQGEESKVVILSTVRCNPEGRIGFLKTPNRINVGCSRAKNGFYIIGDATFMSGVKMWHQIVDELRVKGKIGREFRACCPRHRDQVYAIQSPEQWYEILKCKVPCGSKLPCGHVCKMDCHAPALHARIRCPEPCQKYHEACGHSCTGTCGEPCGECAFEISPITLSCGHEAMRTCGAAQKANDVLCQISLEPNQLACGHWQVPSCSAKDHLAKCTEKCDKLLSCGHRCRGNCHTCGVNGSHPLCISACGKELQCGHHCTARCHIGSNCPPCQQPCRESCKHSSCSRGCSAICDPCVKLCDWNCDHLGSCTTMCCLPCNRAPCSEPCTETLPCGHLCPSLCGERCAIRCLQCTTGKFYSKVQMFLPCGHHFDVEFLDARIGLPRLYQLDSTGRIQYPQVSLIGHALDIETSCPTCGASCHDVRRYSLARQLRDFEGNLDRLYAKLTRKLHMHLGQLYEAKICLDASFPSFNARLRPGPLTGRANNALVHERGNALAEVQRRIINFNGMILSMLQKYSSIQLLIHDR